MSRGGADRPGRQPARIRFLGGRARNTAARSRATGKKARRADADADADGAAEDGSLRLAGVGGTAGGRGGAHADFRGAGGHSAGARSRLSSDVGVVGSASCSCSCAPFSAGGKDEATGSAVVLIGGSAAGRTSAAAELIWPP